MARHTPATGGFASVIVTLLLVLGAVFFFSPNRAGTNSPSIGFSRNSGNDPLYLNALTNATIYSPGQTVALYGTVMEIDGMSTPVGNAEVDVLVQSEGNSTFAMSQALTTGEDGSFEFDFPAPVALGNYSIAVNAYYQIVVNGPTTEHQSLTAGTELEFTVASTSSTSTSTISTTGGSSSTTTSHSTSRSSTSTSASTSSLSTGSSGPPPPSSSTTSSSSSSTAATSSTSSAGQATTAVVVGAVLVAAVAAGLFLFRSSRLRKPPPRRV